MASEKYITGINESLFGMAEQIQSDCHKTVVSIMRKKGTNISYQDATNVFIFRKLAEMQDQINYLNSMVSLK